MNTDVLLKYCFWIELECFSLRIIHHKILIQIAHSQLNRGSFTLSFCLRYHTIYYVHLLITRKVHYNNWARWRRTELRQFGLLFNLWLFLENRQVNLKRYYGGSDHQGVHTIEIVAVTKRISDSHFKLVGDVTLRLILWLDCPGAVTRQDAIALELDIAAVGIACPQNSYSGHLSAASLYLRKRKKVNSGLCLFALSSRQAGIAVN